MGISADLFFTNSDSENCLAYRIKPAAEQREAQQERWNDLKDVLIEKLKEKSGYSISSWLQGSYKFGTQIRPAKSGDEFDIDLGIYFEWDGEPEDGDYNPDELKEFVQEILNDYADDDANEAKEVSEPKLRCNRIRFEGDFHIDVPSYHLDRSRDKRALATENGDWEDSDPKEIYIWWKDSLNESQRARARRLVRYLKMWVALKIAEGKRPSSILLTVLTCEIYQELDEDELDGDDEYFSALVETILDRLRDSVEIMNPVNEEEDLNRLTDNANANFISELEKLLGIAERALEAQTKTDSADTWTEAFDHFFPMPEEEEITEDLRKNAIAHLSFDPQVEVTAKIVGKKTITGHNRIGPIPRGCEIKFVLANASDLPNGAEVNWIVRNSGSDAEAVNDLGHRNQNGINAEERSEYRGNHYMDVTVRYNGRSIGRRRVLVKVSSLGKPVRNPVKKGWVFLR